MSKKFVMSYSCGKDSTLALYRMIKNGHKPVALLITVDKKVLRSWFHGVPESLLQEVSKSLNIPLLLVKCEGEEYKAAFNKALNKAKNELGAEACVFGDIDLEAHRVWCTDRCDEANMEAIFPLWLEDREPRALYGTAQPRCDRQRKAGNNATNNFRRQGARH